MPDDSRSPVLNPWQPMTDPLDLKHLGKFIEECTEAGSAAARCLIQGIDECEPVTKKINREWLEDEIADVMANITLVTQHFKLDLPRIMDRRFRKIQHLRAWHNMLKKEN